MNWKYERQRRDWPPKQNNRISPFNKFPKTFDYIQISAPFVAAENDDSSVGEQGRKLDDVIIETKSTEGGGQVEQVGQLNMSLTWEAAACSMLPNRRSTFIVIFMLTVINLIFLR